jgi:hypothetical protein
VSSDRPGKRNWKKEPKKTVGRVHLCFALNRGGKPPRRVTSSSHAEQTLERWRGTLARVFWATVYCIHTGAPFRNSHRRMSSSEMLRRVTLVRTDVSEEYIASIIMVTRIGELWTTIALTSKRSTLRRNMWSGGQSSWLQTQKSRVRFPALPDFLSGSGSGTGSTQPPEDKWGSAWKKK